MRDRVPQGRNQISSRTIRPWSSLLSRDFRLIWGSSVLTAIAVQIRHVSNLYQVYALSGSAFQLGLAGFFQALPFALFGLFAGAVADAVDRKKLILVTQSLNLVPSIGRIKSPFSVLPLRPARAPAASSRAHPQGDRIARMTRLSRDRHATGRAGTSGSEG